MLNGKIKEMWITRYLTATLAGSFILTGIGIDYATYKNQVYLNNRSYQVVKKILPQRLDNMEDAIKTGDDKDLETSLKEIGIHKKYTGFRREKSDLVDTRFIGHPIEGYRDLTDRCLEPVENMMDEMRDLSRKKDYVSYIHHESFKKELEKRIEKVRENIKRYQHKKGKFCPLWSILIGSSGVMSSIFVSAYQKKKAKAPISNT